MFTHVYICVIFLMKKLVLERATCSLCSSELNGSKSSDQSLASALSSESTAAVGHRHR